MEHENSSSGPGPDRGLNDGRSQNEWYVII